MVAAGKRKIKRSEGLDSGPKASSSTNDDAQSSNKIQKAFFKNATNWNLEQDYESRPRKRNKREKESTRLPIKTADGRLQHVTAPDANDDAGHESEISDGDWLEGDSMDGSISEIDDEKQEDKPEIPIPEQIRLAQEELAKIATSLTMDPEDHPGAFRALAKIGESKIVAIQKLAVMTQMTVYKDVIPGYRIRPAEEGSKEQLSKETRTLRAYEQALVAGYQAYIKMLSHYAKSDPMGLSASRKKGSLGSIAIVCTCMLLKSVPHFNFRSELIKIVVWKLSRRKVDDDFVRCLDTLRELFAEDEDGRYGLEVISLLTKMMKVREFQVDESVVNLFLDLRLLSEFSGKASNERVEMEASGPKPKKVFLTKRQRKNRKEQKSLDKDMAQAEAVVSHEERERMQSETLKLVFATYFRILKQRLPHLMGATLEGLAKYSHLINQDFFGDLLEALKDLIRHADNDANAELDGKTEENEEDQEGQEEEEESAPTRNTSREALLCNATAFSLLAGQDAHNARNDLHLDLSHFTTHLYRSLLALSVNPDLEKTARSHLWDPTQPKPARVVPNKVNLQTTTVLLIRCLTAVLLPHWGIRSVPPVQLAAFSKQLMSSSLHMPEKSCRAVLALLTDVADTHSKKVASLWNTEERKGDGAFNPVSETIGGSNPFAATVWEGEILRKHFSPQVRDGVKLLERTIGGGNGRGR
ncbi:Nucleolar complex-associated protein 3 [Ceratocystis platani]|uniref:Nucleolar complex-associated protein 3 n=1 Tax=Ceratocystis fimbriata f. sp. platani TaxID=88771 RepID=A0A0F8D3V0_CERFI|nr:Nucleolar complex-associated protein 3 [Ceratocystis platani]